MTRIGWNFDNSYLDLPKVFYSKININPVSNPQLVILNKEKAIYFIIFYH